MLLIYPLNMFHLHPLNINNNNNNNTPYHNTPTQLTPSLPILLNTSHSLHPTIHTR